jgi:uncharacterized membrane protein
MHLKSWVSAALAAALAFVPATPAFAQKGPATGGEIITIRVCNNTNDNARVALSYQGVGSNIFNNEGWFSVASRSCEDIRDTTNAYFYGYAEVENDGSMSDVPYWAGDFPLCVMYPGPYQFYTYGTECETGQEVRQFVAMHAENWGSYTWTLDPP